MRHVKKNFDKEVSTQLNNRGSTEECINQLENVVYEEAIRIFGSIPKRAEKGKKADSRRERKLVSIKRNIKLIAAELKNCEDEETKLGLELVMDENKSERRRLRRLEVQRKRRWRRNRARTKFCEKPHSTVKELLSDKKHVPLKVEKSLLDEYILSVASGPQRDVDLNHLPGLPILPDQTVPSNSKLVRFHKFNACLKKREMLLNQDRTKFHIRCVKSVTISRNFCFQSSKMFYT